MFHFSKSNCVVQPSILQLHAHFMMCTGKLVQTTMLIRTGLLLQCNGYGWRFKCLIGSHIIMWLNHNDILGTVRFRNKLIHRNFWLSYFWISAYLALKRCEFLKVEHLGREFLATWLLLEKWNILILILLNKKKKKLHLDLKFKSSNMMVIKLKKEEGFSLF